MSKFVIPESSGKRPILSWSTPGFAQGRRWRGEFAASCRKFSSLGQASSSGRTYLRFHGENPLALARKQIRCPRRSITAPGRWPEYSNSQSDGRPAGQDRSHVPRRGTAADKTRNRSAAQRDRDFEAVLAGFRLSLTITQ